MGYGARRDGVGDDPDRRVGRLRVARAVEGAGDDPGLGPPLAEAQVARKPRADAAIALGLRRGIRGQTRPERPRQDGNLLASSHAQPTARRR